MATEDWIEVDEAVELAKSLDIENPEKWLKEQIAVLQSSLFEDEYKPGFINKKHLDAWIKQGRKSQIHVNQISHGIRDILLAHYHTLYAKEQAQHSGMRGELYEALLRDFLRDYLPQRFYIGTGQVMGSNPSLNSEGLYSRLSKQIDIVIFDALNHPILLPKYELFPIEGTLAVIEVKSKLTTQELVGDGGALENIESAKRLLSKEADTVLQTPRIVEIEGQNAVDVRSMPSPLGVVFAFESPTSVETLIQQWKNWNSAKFQRYRTDMICLLNEKVLMIDTNCFERLWDYHQIGAPDPLASRGKNKLIALESLDVLFFFLNLLLQRLRKMSAFSQHLTMTTPSSYLEESEKWLTRLCVDNSPDPHTMNMLRDMERIMKNSHDDDSGPC